MAISVADLLKRTAPKKFTGKRGGSYVAKTLSNVRAMAGKTGMPKQSKTGAL